MLNLYNSNGNFNLMNVNYKKLKLHNLFLNSKFIIFLDFDNSENIKDKIISNEFYSLILEKKYIKSLFNLSNFSFLRNNNFICIFIFNVINFINFIKNIENKFIFIFYNKNISNVMSNLTILSIFNKYNRNYIYIQFVLKKIKIKIIILFLFFLISLIKYLK